MSKMKICDFIDKVGDGIHGTPKYDDEGTYFFINGNNLVNGKIEITNETLKISDLEYERIKRPINNNTLLLSINGTLGKIAVYNGEKVALGKSVCFINVKEQVNKYFIKYILSTKEFQKYIQLVSHGSTIKNLSPSQVADYEFNCCNYEYQDKIAFLLKSLDEKIDNNNKINEELESMAKTIYDYWFLQFEFPNEEGKPYKSSGGKMVWNEELKRKIPEGWGKGYLRDILNLHTDTISKKQIKKTDLYTPIDCLPKKKMCFYDEALIEEAQSSLIKYRKRDILLGAMRVYFHRVCIAPSDGITRTTTFVLRPKHDKNLGFSYQTINRNDSIDYATKNSIGTQQPYAVWENNLEDFYFAMPPLELMIKYSERVENSIKLIIKNTKEIKELTSLRDFILPLLMTGQVGFRELALVED